MQDDRASPPHKTDSGGPPGLPAPDATGGNDGIGGGGDCPALEAGFQPAPVATPTRTPSPAGPSIPPPPAYSPESGARGAGAHPRNKRTHEAESAEDVAGGNSGEMRARPRPRPRSRTASPRARGAQDNELGDLMTDTDKYLAVFQHLFNAIKGAGGGDAADSEGSTGASGGNSGGNLPSSEARVGLSTSSTDPSASNADGAAQAEMNSSAPETQSSNATETSQPQAFQMRAQQAVPMLIDPPASTTAPAPVRSPVRSSIGGGRRMSVTELSARLSQWECGACHKSNPTTTIDECMYCDAPGPVDNVWRRDPNDPRYNPLLQLHPMDEDTAEETNTSTPPPASPAPTWMCLACNAMNYRFVSKCHLCEGPRGLQLGGNAPSESDAATHIDATSSPPPGKCKVCHIWTDLASEDGCPWCRSSRAGTPAHANDGEGGNERPFGASGPDDSSSMASNVASTSGEPPTVASSNDTASHPASTSTAPIDPMTADTRRCKVCHIKTNLTTENGCHWCNNPMIAPPASNHTPSSPVRARALDLPAASTPEPTGEQPGAPAPIQFRSCLSAQQRVSPPHRPFDNINHRPRWTCQFCTTETVVSERNCTWCNVPRFTVPFDEEDPADNDDTDIIVVLRSELNSLPRAVAYELEHDSWVRRRSETATIPEGCVRVRACRFFDAIEQVEREMEPEVEHVLQELQAEQTQQAVQEQDTLELQGTQEEQDTQDTEDVPAITSEPSALIADDAPAPVIAAAQSDQAIMVDRVAIGAPADVIAIPVPWNRTGCRCRDGDNTDCEVCKYPPLCYEPEYAESLQSPPDTAASVVGVQDTQAVESGPTECSWECHRCLFDNVDNATGKCEGCHYPPPSGENEASGAHSSNTDANVEDVQDTQPADSTPSECSHCSHGDEAGADLCDRCGTLRLFTYGNCGRSAALQPQAPRPRPQIPPGASWRVLVGSHRYRPAPHAGEEEKMPGLASFARNSSDPVLYVGEEEKMVQYQRVRDSNFAIHHPRGRSRSPADRNARDKGKGRATDAEDTKRRTGRRCEITLFQAEVLALFEKGKLWTEEDLELALGCPLRRVHIACCRLARYGAITAEGEGIWRHVSGHSLANRPLDPVRLAHNHSELGTAERELDTLRLGEIRRNLDELRADIKTQATSFSSHYTVTNEAQDDLSDRLTATNLSLEGLSDAFKEVRSHFRAMRDVATARERNRTNHYLGRPLVTVPRPDGILPVHLATLSCYDDLASLTSSDLEEWLQFYADEEDLSIGKDQWWNAMLALAGYLGLESVVSTKLAHAAAGRPTPSSAAATTIDPTADNTPASPTAGASAPQSAQPITPLGGSDSGWTVVEPKGKERERTEDDRPTSICTKATAIQVPAAPTSTPTRRLSLPNIIDSYRPRLGLEVTDVKPVFQDAWCTIYRGTHRDVPPTAAVESPASHSGSDTASTTKSPESTPWTLLESDGADLSDMRSRRESTESTESTLMGDVPMISFSRPPSAGPGPSSSEAAARRAAQAWLHNLPFGCRSASTDAPDPAAQVAADEAFALAMAESCAMAHPAAVQIKQDEQVARALADEQDQDPWLSLSDMEWEPRATVPNAERPIDEDLDIQRALLQENEERYWGNLH